LYTGAREVEPAAPQRRIASLRELVNQAVGFKVAGHA
jgi:hypothetical protein